MARQPLGHPPPRTCCIHKPILFTAQGSPLSALWEWLKLLVVGSAFKMMRRLMFYMYRKIYESLFIMAIFEENDTSYHLCFSLLIDQVSHQPTWHYTRNIQVSIQSFSLDSITVTIEYEDASDPDYQIPSGAQAPIPGSKRSMTFVGSAREPWCCCLDYKLAGIAYLSNANSFQWIVFCNCLIDDRSTVLTAVYYLYNWILLSRGTQDVVNSPGLANFFKAWKVTPPPPPPCGNNIPHKVISKKNITQKRKLFFAETLKHLVNVIPSSWYNKTVE